MTRTLPMRPQEPIFEHETRSEVDGITYDCRIEFTVASDDAVYIAQVDVWMGSLKHGRWQDCRDVLERDISEALHEKADNMAEVLFDTVAVEVEDFRAEQMNADHELRIDNADDRGHAHRERMAERIM